MPSVIGGTQFIIHNIVENTPTKSTINLLGMFSISHYLKSRIFTSWKSPPLHSFHQSVRCEHRAHSTNLFFNKKCPLIALALTITSNSSRKVVPACSTVNTHTHTQQRTLASHMNRITYRAHSHSQPEYFYISAQQSVFFSFFHSFDLDKSICSCKWAKKKM